MKFSSLLNRPIGLVQHRSTGTVINEIGFDLFQCFSNDQKQVQTARKHSERLFDGLMSVYMTDMHVYSLIPLSRRRIL